MSRNNPRVTPLNSESATPDQGGPGQQEGLMQPILLNGVLRRNMTPVAGQDGLQTAAGTPRSDGTGNTDNDGEHSDQSSPSSSGSPGPSLFRSNLLARFTGDHPQQANENARPQQPVSCFDQIGPWGVCALIIGIILGLFAVLLALWISQASSTDARPEPSPTTPSFVLTRANITEL